MCELVCLVWSPCYSSHAWNCFELRFNWDALKWIKRSIYVCKLDVFMCVIPHCTLASVCVQCKRRFEIIIQCFSRSYLDTVECHNGFSSSIMRIFANTFLNNTVVCLCVCVCFAPHSYTYLFTHLFYFFPLKLFCYYCLVCFFIWDRDSVKEKDRDIQ